MGATAIVRQINAQTNAQLTNAEVHNYARALASGSISRAQVTQVARDRAATRQANRQRMTLLATNLGLPKGYVDGFVDKFIEYGDVELALTDVRQSPDYDRYFPGNRRDDGTVRFTEREYQVVTESYAATLEDVGLNPDLFASKFGDVIAGDVSPDEFAGRVQALWQGVIRAPDEVREAAATEFGLPSSDPSVLLGIALDPDIGEQVRDRRIAISQVTGQASRFGFNRSRDRVSALLDAGLSSQQASELYAGAVPTVQRLSASGGLSGEDFGIDQFEDAAVFGSPDALRTASRLDQQQRSRFSRATGVQQDNTGALTGLNRR